MNIIVIKKGKSPKAYRMENKLHYLAISAVCLGVISLIFVAGYQLGAVNTPKDYVDAWKAELSAQQAEIASLKEHSKAHIESLTARIGRLQGHVTRMDALGGKLVVMANLDDEEFNFGDAPALGGPNEGAVFNKPDSWGLELAIQDLNKQLVGRHSELEILEEVMRRRALSQEVHPKGRPVKRGWISSYFGYRSSPFKGGRELHKGIDIAAKEGSEILAVAGGVITRSGMGTGYGNIVEIDHGNGYKTKYAHNKANLVIVGQAVKKGEPIAILGSTGRSTGPHVHFEVIKNGKAVDPVPFMRSN